MRFDAGAGAGAGGHALVVASSSFLGDRLPAASTASTANPYVFPQVSPPAVYVVYVVVEPTSAPSR